jgi:dolichyl-phosphate beta-glucosyltransferase
MLRPVSQARAPRLLLVTTTPPDLSIILPCFRAAPLARRSVGRLGAALEDSGLSWEVLVVDDGGADFDSREWRDDDRVALLTHSVNRGKGAAVRTGMLAARGQVRIFTDVDLPFGTDLLPVMHAYLRDGVFHLVIGDRTLPGSRYHQSTALPRRIASALFTGFVGRIVTGGFFDTQCGLKGLRGDVADALFPLLQLDRFAFDVELVYVALKHRLDIKRIPVQLVHNETSSVRLLRDSSRGVFDVARIKANQLRGLYQSAVLEAIVRKDFEAARHAAGTATASTT